MTPHGVHAPPGGVSMKTALILLALAIVGAVLLGCGAPQLPTTREASQHSTELRNKVDAAQEAYLGLADGAMQAITYLGNTPQYEDEARLARGILAGMRSGLMAAEIAVYQYQRGALAYEDAARAVAGFESAVSGLGEVVKPLKEAYEDAAKAVAVGAGGGHDVAAPARTEEGAAVIQAEVAPKKAE